MSHRALGFGRCDKWPAPLSHAAVTATMTATASATRADADETVKTDRTTKSGVTFKPAGERGYGR